MTEVRYERAFNPHRVLIPVTCPICTKELLERDINVHLDFQCPGTTGETSKSSSQPLAASHATTPPQNTPGRELKATASVVGKRKADEEVWEESSRILGSNGDTAAREVFKRERRDDKLAEQPKRGEKRVKMNPLTANQPYVFLTSGPSRVHTPSPA